MSTSTGTSDTMYRYFSLPVPATPSALAAYKEFRLTFLKVDAACFASSYAREVALTDDIWYKRLNSPFKRTFVAEMASEARQSVLERGNDSQQHETLNESSWVGAVTICAPSGLLPTTTEPLVQAGLYTNWEPYLLVGMWVRPEHRGKGVGKELVKRGLDWAKTFTDPKFNGADKKTEKVAVLVVYDYNTAARALYNKLGFRDLKGIPWEGQTWMAMKV
ncbi:hypothetical protein ID866_4276 [Astraeus odoratus]|nr:hypothetical protein ID866_4276 [Astraeus odoratus]